MGTLLRDGAALGGAIAIGYGLWSIYPPLFWLYVGALMLAIVAWFKLSE